MFSRNYGAQFDPGTVAADTLAGVRGAGGDWVQYLREKMKTKGHGTIASEVGHLATVLRAGDKTMSPEKAEGLLFDQLSMEEDFAPVLKTSGAHASEAAKRDKVAQEEKAKMEEADLKFVAKKLSDLIDEMKKSADRYEKLDEAGRTGGKAAGGTESANAFNTALRVAAGSVKTYTTQLGEFAGAVVKTGPKRP